MSRILFFVLLAVLGPTTLTANAFAKDVYVKGYARKDGTYVRPHVRSSPDSHLSNNYGPSQTDDQLMNPRSRDYDGDGVANYLDHDDDNDGFFDDSDPNQFGGGGYATKPTYIAPVPSVASIVVSPGVDYFGGDYAEWRPTSLKACHDYCYRDSQCRGFSYVESKNWCWLKSALGVPRSVAGIVSGAKQ